ncbi:MAG: hypothetical protein ABEJ56_05790 [Candidatus Nanohaloarchaea archaeon]
MAFWLAAIPGVLLVAGLAAVSSFLVHWVSIGAGAFGAAILLKRLVDEDPVPLTSNEDVNHFIYAGFSAVMGFLAYKVVQYAFAVAGLLLSIAIAAVIVAGYYFGFSVVLAALADFALEFFDGGE